MPSQALQTFFQMLAQAETQQPYAPPQLPAELANLDQLKVLLDALVAHSCHKSVTMSLNALANTSAQLIPGLL